MYRPIRFALPLLAALSASNAAAQTFSTLHSYWSGTQLDNLCSTSPSIYASPFATYGWYRSEGLVFSPSVALPAGLLDMKRLERWYSPSRGDYFTTTDPAWQGSSGQTRGPDYTWSAHEGWVFPDPVAGTSELRGYWNASRGDNFITSNTLYNTYLSVPGYSGIGSQGYIINSALGQTDLIDNFNFGTLFGGSAAVGGRQLMVLLLQHSDFPMRHTQPQFNGLFYGLTFPTVNGFFQAASMDNWLWLNAGVRGPYTIANEPDTTGDESKWRDTWDSTYAPFLYLGLRAASDAHWITSPGGPGSGASAAAGFGDAYETFTLADINGGNLISGDTVAFKTYNKTWLRVSGTTVLGDAGSSAGADARFLISKVAGSAGTQIVNTDTVRLKNIATGLYLRAVGSGGGALVCDVAVAGTDSNFDIFKFGMPIAWQVREGLRQAAASTLNLASYDTNADGQVTTNELQVFVITSGPADPPGPAAATDGAAARYGGYYQPPGSTVVANLGAVAGAGEDVSLMTICHELTHLLGANYELYGAEGLNQNMATMGATIYNTIDERSSYMHDPFTRMRLGWLRPRVFSMSDAGASATLDVADDGPDSTNRRPILLVDPLRFNFDTGEGEYFLLEYRNPNVVEASYDTNAASQGLCIWQCKTGPGGANIAIPSIAGACCTGAACVFTRATSCAAVGQVFKGLGTVCDSAGACPAGSPPPVVTRDGSVNLLGAPTYIRGGGTGWTTANQPGAGIVPKYVDGSNAPVVIRVGAQTTTGRSLNVEWSYSGDLPARIDSVSKTRFRKGGTISVNGMFGLRTRQLYLHSAAGTYIGGLTITTSLNTLTQTTARVPTHLPIGSYRMTEAFSLTSFPSNEVQVQITPRSDWNEDGVLSVQDIFDLLNDWFAGSADYSGNGATTVQDIFDLLNDWFAGI